MAAETCGPLLLLCLREILEQIRELANVDEDLVPGMTLADMQAAWEAWCEGPPWCDAAAGGQGAGSGLLGSDAALSCSD